MNVATFTVAGITCGIDVDTVREVLDGQRVTPVPLAPGSVDGLVNLRGQIVVAIDLRHRLGLQCRDGACTRMNVVVDLGDGPVSLIVDAVGEVVEIEPEATIPTTLDPTLRALVTGVAELRGQTLLVLDADGLVTPEGRDRAHPLPA